MLAACVLVALGTVGSLANASTANDRSKSSMSRPSTTMSTRRSPAPPSGRDVYASDRSLEVDADVRGLAARAYTDSWDPRRTGVVNDYGFAHAGADHVYDGDVSALSGLPLPRTADFHNNLMPFGVVRQSLAPEANRGVLENFTGVSDIQFAKCEVGSFCDVRPDVNFAVTGGVTAQAFDAQYRSRFVDPTARNNFFPEESQRVGPGLGLGFTTTGAGGMQQFEAEEFARRGYKSLEDLRPVQTKTTHLGRVIQGKALVGRRADGPAEVPRNRPETFVDTAVRGAVSLVTGAVLRRAWVSRFSDPRRTDANAGKFGAAGSGATSKARGYLGLARRPSAKRSLQARGASGHAYRGGSGRARTRPGGNTRRVRATFASRPTGGAVGRRRPGRAALGATGAVRRKTTLAVAVANVRATMYAAALGCGSLVTGTRRTATSAGRLGHAAGAGRRGAATPLRSEARRTVKDFTTEVPAGAQTGGLLGVVRRIQAYLTDAPDVTLADTLLYDATPRTTLTGPGAKKTRLYNTDRPDTTSAETLLYDGAPRTTLTGATRTRLYNTDPLDPTSAQTLLYDATPRSTVTGPGQRKTRAYQADAPDVTLADTLLYDATPRTALTTPGAGKTRLYNTDELDPTSADALLYDGKPRSTLTGARKTRLYQTDAPDVTAADTLLYDATPRSTVTGGGSRRGTARVDQRARTTVKETTAASGGPRSSVTPGVRRRPGGYATGDHAPRPANKGVYREHAGPATCAPRPTDRTDVDCVVTDDRRDAVLRGLARPPTTVGAATFSGSESVAGFGSRRSDASSAPAIAPGVSVSREVRARGVGQVSRDRGLAPTASRDFGSCLVANDLVIRISDAA